MGGEIPSKSLNVVLRVLERALLIRSVVVGSSAGIECAAEATTPRDFVVAD